jgi:hypothetical protein
MIEFCLIMGIGTVIAVLSVASLPNPTGARYDNALDAKPNDSRQTPACKKDLSEVFPINDLDYLWKLDRHERDPEHWPAPHPPVQSSKAEGEYY